MVGAATVSALAVALFVVAAAGISAGIYEYSLSHARENARNDFERLFAADLSLFSVFFEVGDHSATEFEGVQPSVDPTVHGARPSAGRPPPPNTWMP
jgi:hypothetical protein